MESYNKQPLTYNKQVELLEGRGLIIPNKEEAEKLLGNISYYRLSAYMLPYKKYSENLVCDIKSRKEYTIREYKEEFEDNVTWNTIIQLYGFDRKLRILVFDAIERIEIALRSQIINQLSLKYGSHWQDDLNIFKPPTTKTLRDGKILTIDVFEEIQKHIKEQLNNNKAEVFIQHYKSKYNSPENPPSWMSVEIMYFSHLSRICTGLRNRKDIVGISSYFNLPPDTFCSWLHTINYIRNICAHHSRLWNRDLNIIPEKLLFSKKLNWITNPQSVRRSKLYYFLCMINYLLQTANPTSPFKQRLIGLLDEYKNVISLESMGFSENWYNEKMWKV
ncbi:MAG: Abi family protein [Bacteroidales bacterium]|nr:Abi family protein [Bacteroidales bacterium]